MEEENVPGNWYEHDLCGVVPGGAGRACVSGQNASIDRRVCRRAYQVCWQRANGEWVVKQTSFDQKVDSLQRLVFRTGPTRELVPPLIVDGERSPGYHGEDLAGADLRTPLSVYMIDDVKTAQP